MKGKEGSGDPEGWEAKSGLASSGRGLDTSSEKGFCADVGKGFDLFAKRINGRPVGLMNLMDHLYNDHIFFAGSGSPNFLVLIYLMKKVQEVGT